MTQKRNLQGLRRGYTTGACAAAAARAAATALVRQETVTIEYITLPGGERSGFNIHRCVFDRYQGKCCVIKDAGDDPDITNGAEICATVSFSDTPGIHIEGGPGVGTVTKPGLETAVGAAAINPVPRKMICDEIEAVAGAFIRERGLKVIISVPEGVELAKHTLNQRLGIVGGISILGTTGIVIPYSVNAYTACISQSIDVAAACGCREVVLTTGRRSEKFAQRALGFTEECFILAGDYIGFSLNESSKRPLTKVTIWGMPGKISKLAAGAMNTHVSDSAIDTGFLLAAAEYCGIPEGILKELATTVGANHFLQNIPSSYVECFSDRLCSLAAENCRDAVNRALTVECIMADYEGTILGRASVEK